MHGVNFLVCTEPQKGKVLRESEVRLVELVRGVNFGRVAWQTGIVSHWCGVRLKNISAHENRLVHLLDVATRPNPQQQHLLDHFDVFH